MINSIFFNHSLFKSILIYTLSILMALVLGEMGLRAENILLIFVVGILITIVETDNLIYGIIYSIIYVFTFNYFFTEPKFTFNVNDPNYFVSFGIFFVVVMIVATLTVRLQKQRNIATQNAHIAEKLYEISKGFLYLADEQSTLAYCEKELSDLIGRKVEIFLITQKTEKSTITKEILWCYDNSFPCGTGETQFAESLFKYLPLRNGLGTIGVVKIDCKDKEFDFEESKQLSTVLSQFTLAIDRLWLNIAEKDNKIKIESENLRNNLLRSISHDLRTPLTSITGGSEFLLENISTLSHEEAKTVLSDIASESYWLSNLVENLLDMTRIQEGQLTVTKKNEVIDDIIDTCVAKMNKRKNDHTIQIIKPKDIVVAPIDSQLIMGVLINLLDNAFRHTQEDSTIIIDYSIEKNYLHIDICDNGPGIKKDQLDKIFDRFYTNSSKTADGHRGIGLGLSICKSIINAHKGELVAKNNKAGGACFKVMLPLGEEHYG